VIFCTGILKQKTNIECGGLPSKANRQKIHYHPTIVSHENAIQNAHPRDKRGLNLNKYSKMGMKYVPCICKTNNRKCTKDAKLTTRCIRKRDSTHSNTELEDTALQNFISSL
jgi:hypothetical protein